MGSGYHSCTRPSWKALDFKLLYLNRGLCVEHSSDVNYLYFLCPTALVEQNPRPPPTRTDGEG